MSFRLISVPLNKRTEQEAINNELIVDNIHGNIGISTTDSSDNKIYNSGTENLKAELDSLKIRNANMNKDLVKISYGSEMNTKLPDFEPNNALENKDLLGSIQYLRDLYMDFIDSIDEDGNPILKEDAFEYSSELKAIVTRLYEKDGYSYSSKFRTILEELYVEELNNTTLKDKDEDKTSMISDSTTINYLNLAVAINDIIPFLYRMESEIINLEAMINTINSDIGYKGNNGNIELALKDAKEQIENLKYKTKCKKFKEFNFSDNISKYQILDSDKKYKFSNEKEKTYENISKVFNDNFISSVLDDNYDGDVNLHQIDGIYNLKQYANNDLIRRISGAYISGKKQKYFYPPTTNLYAYNGNKTTDFCRAVYDPELGRVIYKYEDFSYYDDKEDFDCFDYPLLEYYYNDNNLIIQNVTYGKTANFEIKNLDSDSQQNISKLLLSSNIVESKFTNGEFYFPTLYNLNATFPTFDFTDKSNFDFNYFVGLNLIIPIAITKTVTTTTTTTVDKEETTDSNTASNTASNTSTDETTDTNSSTDSTETETTTTTTSSTSDYFYYLLREGYEKASYGYNTTGIPNERFSADNNSIKNNKTSMSNLYYKGFNPYYSDSEMNRKFSINSINTVKKDFNNYIDYLDKNIEYLLDNIDKLNFPNFFNTSILINSNNTHTMNFIFKQSTEKNKTASASYYFTKYLDNRENKIGLLPNSNITINKSDNTTDVTYNITYSAMQTYKFKIACNNLFGGYNCSTEKTLNKFELE
jgi:hypothetical protein